MLLYILPTVNKGLKNEGAMFEGFIKWQDFERFMNPQ